MRCVVDPNSKVVMNNIIVISRTPITIACFQFRHADSNMKWWFRRMHVPAYLVFAGVYFMHCQVHLPVHTPWPIQHSWPPSVHLHPHLLAHVNTVNHGRGRTNEPCHVTYAAHAPRYHSRSSFRSCWPVSSTSTGSSTA